jgi:hypothetical protein
LCYGPRSRWSVPFIINTSLPHILNIEFDAIPNEFDIDFFHNLTHEESLILDGVQISAPAQYVG